MFLKSINWPILLSVTVLLSISVLVIYSSAPNLAFQQLLFAIVGIILFFFLSNLDYHFLKEFSKPTYFLIIFLLVVVLLLGFETRGSLRWIPLGPINIQPSEFAKPVVIIFLATYWLSSNYSWVSITKGLLWFLPVIFLVFKQPDLGTTITIVSIWFGMFFASRVSPKKIIAIILAIALTLPLVWFTLKDYQKQRITSFMSPTSDPLGVGYNLIQSTIAVGSGKLTGRGLGYGTQSRLQFLPEYRTDFIFATIGEEFGFLGSGLILVIYVYLISYCLRVAAKADYFGSLIVTGVAVMIFFQAAVNIGMNIGILPITGITLPLISYGGSSLLSILISLGIVASVARRQQTENLL